MTERLENVLVSLIQALEQTGIPYTLVGGMAVLAWGDPRTTRDIDVIADLDRADLKPLEETLEPRGFSFDMEGAETALRQGSHFTIFHEENASNSKASLAGLHQRKTPSLTNSSTDPSRISMMRRES